MCRRAVVQVTVAANKNTNGTGFWRTTPITTAKASLWTGSCFHPAACAAATRYEAEKCCWQARAISRPTAPDPGSSSSNNHKSNYSFLLFLFSTFFLLNVQPLESLDYSRVVFVYQEVKIQNSRDRALNVVPTKCALKATGTAASYLISSNKPNHSCFWFINFSLCRQKQNSQFIIKTWK